MASPKRSDTIVIDTVLAFIQCKLDVMDQVSLTQILTSSYTEAQIADAKKVLHDTAATTIRLITRQREGRGKKDIEDIFKVFLETDPDDVPTFVCRDLTSLPPLTWEHVDVTCVLKQITQLKADVSSIQAQLQLSEQTVSELKLEIVALRNVNAVPAISPQSAQNVNMRRGAIRCRTSPVSSYEDATFYTDTQVNDRPASLTSAPGTSAPQSAISAPPPAPRAPPAPAPPARQQKKSYAQVSRHPQPARPAPNAETHRMSQARPKKPSGGLHKVDDEGFTIVEKKRRPKSSRNRRGTAPLSAGLTLQTVEPTVSIYVSRLDPTTTGESILRYVDERGRCRIREPPAVLVHGLKRLESNRETNFKSYVLRVAAKYKDVFLAPDFWSAGVVYRRYREAPLTKKVP